MANSLQTFNRAITNESTQKYLQDVLGERKGSFVNNLTALVANNSNLQECEPFTIMFAAMKATALNLPLDNSLGMAYVLPYKDNKRGTTVAQFQLGYKAYKQLALRTGQFKVLNATDVREGEIVSRNRLTGEIKFDFEQDEAKRIELPIVGYVSYFRLQNGFESTFYMAKEEVEKHAKRYSQTYRSDKDYVRNSSKWTTDFDAMALKTVTKLNLSKNAPLSVELTDAINADQSVMREENTYEYLDNEQSEIDEEKMKEVQAMFADFDEVQQ
jgi:recombination protein RecT